MTGHTRHCEERSLLRHCEERSDEAISMGKPDCFAFVRNDGGWQRDCFTFVRNDGGGSKLAMTE